MTTQMQMEVPSESFLDSENWPTYSVNLPSSESSPAVGETLFGTDTFMFRLGESNNPVLALYHMTAEGGEAEFWPLKRRKYLNNT